MRVQPKQNSAAPAMFCACVLGLHGVWPRHHVNVQVGVNASIHVYVLLFCALLSRPHTPQDVAHTRHNSLESWNKGADLGQRSCDCLVVLPRALCLSGLDFQVKPAGWAAAELPCCCARSASLYRPGHDERACMREQRLPEPDNALPEPGLCLRIYVCCVNVYTVYIHVNAADNCNATHALPSCASLRLRVGRLRVGVVVGFSRVQPAPVPTSLHTSKLCLALCDRSQQITSENLAAQT